MKRLWFALVFFIIASTLCLCEQVYISSFYNQMSNMVNAAQESAISNSPDLESKIVKIKKYWLKNNELILTVANHDTLNEIGMKIRSLDADDRLVSEKLAEINALTLIIYENQRITLANIL